MKKIVLATTLAAAMFAAGASAEPQPKASNGMYVNSAGMTLYTFDKDTAGKSACNGPCATNWPPVAASDSDKAKGEFSIITRDDGSKQWAYEGKPLYTFAADKKPGDTTGDGMKDVWHVAK